MSLTIGIVSSSLETAQHMEMLARSVTPADGREYKLFVYGSISEIEDIVKNNKIDGWLFTGPTPYAVARQFISDENVAYGKGTGDELYKCCIEFMSKNHPKKLRVSVDEPDIDFGFAEAIDELDYPTDEFYLFRFPLPMPYGERQVAEHHRKLYEDGKVDVVFTALHHVKETLLSWGVPCYRLHITTRSMRQAAELLEEKLTGAYYKQSQLGMIRIEMVNFDSIISSSGNYYKIKHLEMEIDESIINMCRIFDGYIGNQHSGRYTIFASRGLISSHIKELRLFIDEAKLRWGAKLYIGIGFAATVFSAVENGYKAISEALVRKEPICMIRDDEVLVTAPQTSNEMEFQSKLENKNIAEKLKLAGVSAKTYRETLLIVEKLQLKSFSSAQLAAQMNVTERNVQRILAGLKKGGLVQESGQKTDKRRGRPAKLYSLV